MKILGLFIVWIAFSALPCSACWSAPPDYVVIQGESPEYFIRVDNPNKKLEVRLASDLSETWSIVIPNYDSLFSIVKLSGDGERIIHIVGNHRIQKINQLCVQVFAKDGSELAHSLDEFIDDLDAIKTDQKMSTDPKYFWFGKVNFVTEERLGFTLGNGKVVVVSTVEKKIFSIKNP